MSDDRYAQVFVETNLRWFAQWVCGDCGSVVHDMDQHDEWHAMVNHNAKVSSR